MTGSDFSLKVTSTMRDEERGSKIFEIIKGYLKFFNSEFFILPMTLPRLLNFFTLLPVFHFFTPFCDLELYLLFIMFTCIALRLISYNRMGLYSQGNPFS